ncbi:MAG: hypothetical protein ABJL99_05855 [Aliishimia sp.]
MTKTWQSTKGPHAGRTRVSTCAVVLGLTLIAGNVHADPLQKAWVEFEQRCLIPFEDFAPAQVQDLVPVAGKKDAYHLSGGAILELTGAQADGSRACAVRSAKLLKGFEAWLAEAEAKGRYVLDDTGMWVSHEWIEPVIAVQQSDGVVRVVETERES